MTIENLEKELKSGILKSFYLLYGEETFLLETNLKRIKSLFGDIVQGINYVTINEENLDQIISELETPSFGYEKKLIIVKNTSFFKKEAKKKAKEGFQIIKEKVLNYLEENLQNIKETVVLVFIEKEACKNELFAFIEKNGNVCNFEFQKPNQIQARIKAITNAYKVNIDNSTLNYFIECCGTSMQDLINEIRKLIEYAGNGGTITKQDIDSLSIKKIESVIFDLTDNLGKKEIPKAIEVLHNLILNKEPIQKILITLYNHLKKIYITKLALTEGKNLIEALNLKPNQTFLVNKYKMQANYFSLEEIKTILKELIDLDYKCKIGLIDLNIGFESILCTYF